MKRNSIAIVVYLAIAKMLNESSGFATVAPALSLSTEAPRKAVKIILMTDTKRS